MAIIPQQNRTVDPYSSYKSSKINQFAQLITKTNVSKGIIDGLEVTTGGNTAVNILSGKCLKDNVLIEITESILLTKNNTSCSGVNSGVGYVVINYTYVPTYPPKVAYLDVVTQDEYNNNSSKYIILAGLYNLGNWTSINYNSRMMLSPTDMLTSAFMSFDLQDKYLRRDSDTAPDTNEAYDLGSEDYKFKDIYVKNVNTDTINDEDITNGLQNYNGNNVVVYKNVFEQKVTASYDKNTSSYYMNNFVNVLSIKLPIYHGLDHVDTKVNIKIKIEYITSSLGMGYTNETLGEFIITLNSYSIYGNPYWVLIYVRSFGTGNYCGGNYKNCVKISKKADQEDGKNYYYLHFGDAFILKNGSQLMFNALPAGEYAILIDEVWVSTTNENKDDIFALWKDWSDSTVVVNQALDLYDTNGNQKHDIYDRDHTTAWSHNIVPYLNYVRHAIVPYDNSVYDIGKEDCRFKNVYTKNVNTQTQEMELKIYNGNIKRVKLYNVFQDEVQIDTDDPDWTTLIFIRLPISSIIEDLKFTVQIEVAESSIGYTYETFVATISATSDKYVLTSRSTIPNGYRSGSWDPRVIEICRYTNDNSFYIKLGGSNYNNTGGFRKNKLMLVNVSQINLVTPIDYDYSDWLDSSSYYIVGKARSDIYDLNGVKSDCGFDFTTDVTNTTNPINYVWTLYAPYSPEDIGNGNIGYPNYRFNNVFADTFHGSADQWDGGDKFISNQDASGTAVNGSVWFKYED